MASNISGPPEGMSSLDTSSASTMVPVSGSSSTSKGPEQEPPSRGITGFPEEIEPTQPSITEFEKDYRTQTEKTYSEMSPRSKRRVKARLETWFKPGGNLRPFRLLRQDIGNIRTRYQSDWTTFNQLVFASSVYVFFTNILPGITFASDLYVLTGMTWGTIEVVFSTGLCGLIFSL